MRPGDAGTRLVAASFETASKFARHPIRRAEAGTRPEQQRGVTGLRQKGIPVNRSLSLVLPVCNAEQTLAENLLHVFDVLSDLTSHFEVLLVDEGSTDHTPELAHDLALKYPQLRIARPAKNADESSAIQATLEQARGDVILIQQPHAPFRPSRVRRLWENCATGTVVPLSD